MTDPGTDGTMMLCWICAVLVARYHPASLSHEEAVQQPTSPVMLTIKQRKCFKLNTFVYITTLLMMVSYILVGVGAVAWFVLTQQETETVKTSVIILGSLLVTCLLGLFSCLLLIMGLVTKQVRLLLPWLVYHVSLCCLCLGGGIYQCVYFIYINTLMVCLSVCPIVAAIFLFFFCLFVCQLYKQMKDSEVNKDKLDSDTEVIHMNTLPRTSGTGHRCVRSVRTLKRRSEMRRTRSVDTVLTRDNIIRSKSVDNIHNNIFPDLIRVRSDPYLSIPRASLTRSRKLSSTTDLNNNSLSDTRSRTPDTCPPQVLTRSISMKTPSQPHISMVSNTMTREQIIDLFSASNADTDGCPGPSC